MDSCVSLKRYAHFDGHTVGCFTGDGNYVITCGSDCSVSMWSCSDGETDESPPAIALKEPATCILFKNDKVYMGSGNSVDVYNFPKWEKNDFIPLRFSAPVTTIDISEDDNLFAAGSCDMKIKIINIPTRKITEMVGHTAPILRVSLDPTLNYLASSSSDGSVKVWNIANGEMIKNFSNVIPSCNDFFSAKSLGNPVWMVQKELHILIINHNKISVYSASNWVLAFELSCKKIEKLVTLISLSPCGKLLCGGTSIGEIVIWSLETHEVITYLDDLQKASISDLCWHPSKSDIAYCNRLGILFIAQPKLGDKKDENQENSHTEPRRQDKTSKDDDNDSGRHIADTISGEADDNSISISQIKAEYAMDSDGECNEIDNEVEESEDDYPTKSMLTMDLQPCFQPASTPSHFQHGYMVWNSVGIVRSVNSEEDSYIDVEFHDTMLHHSIHRRNIHDYFIASLSCKVFSLASTRRLTVIMLNAWDEKREWDSNMPPEENIVALATSGEWVCCATDANQLRFYTLSGTQKQVVSLPGPVVCMNGHEGFLIVITHLGIGLPDCQNLGYMIFEISDFAIRAITPFHSVPISPKSKLKWLGFTDEGTPCTYDSSGIVRFSRDFLHWNVVCDTSVHCKNTSNTYFVIGISERLQNVRCILCKGSSYPMTAPRPTVVELPLKIPLCDPEENKTILEDTFWRHVLSLPVLNVLSQDHDEYIPDINAWELILKRTIIKLFAEAYRQGSDMRALEIASLMSEQLLEKSVKLAKAQGRSYLADKLVTFNPKDWSCLREGTYVKATNSLRSLGDYVTKNYDNEIKVNKKYQKYSQGDMFEDSQPSSSRDLAVENINTSSSKQKNETNINSVLNPFKRNNKGDQKPKGLDFFNSVQNSNEKHRKQEVVNSEKVSSSKQSNQSQEKSSNSAPKKLTFVEWFNKEKAMLQLKFPDLTSSEFTKAAMKIFREDVNQRSQNQNQDEFSNESSPGCKKRKIEDDQNNLKATASEKLSAFSFLK